MSFDYRVTKKSYKDGTVEFTIREVYYASPGGEIIAWSENPMDPYGESLEEIKDDLRCMTAALTKPILDLNQLEERFGVSKNSETPLDNDT